MIASVEPPGLHWSVRGERSLYDNQWIQLVLVDVEAPDGRRFESHVARLGRVAIALIVNDAEHVLTLWRYRFATDDWGYELIGGIVEDGEDPSATARREAVEETGWRPIGEPEHLITFQPFPGMVDAPIDVYLWRDAEKIGEPTDAEEAARIEWKPVDGMVELATRGELLGSGT
jgi:8-oxo-dGTP pyrophosphatase MutT (NUDIX family)